jgi:hypothetical protein
MPFSFAYLTVRALLGLLAEREMDSGDGNELDHGDWAGAQIVCTP